jgi:hypothetical protein
MGLLDEAIKQHLELKRRRGADPGEIERLEREALGPVRRLRQEPPAEDPGLAGADVVYEEHEYTEEPSYEENLYEEGEHLGGQGGHEPLEEGLEPLEEGLEPLSRGATSAPETPLRDSLEPQPLSAPGVVPPQGDEMLDDATEREGAQPPEPGDDLGVETVEYDVQAEHAREEGQPDDDESDMLEETPEFFQDAPDHDRLWFEQRPPRDFDFDG